jgi:tetratricopeptide (TPR) repeat protein
LAIALALAVFLADTAPAALCEFVVKREGGTWPAAAGTAAVWPVGIPPEQARMEVVGPAGPVGSRVVWARTGDPLTVIFDTSSGAETYTVRVSDSGVSATLDWTPRAGLVLETRTRADGPVDRLAQIQQLWQRATNTFGRTLVPQIFDGFHRHARTSDFLARYSGWFQAPKDGRYDFAIVADNASFLLVDNRPVAEWPGWHGVEGSRHGQHAGSIELKRGLHQIEFWNAQAGPGFSVSVAWIPPGATRFATIPAEAFAPVAPFRVSAVHGEPINAAFSWEITHHALAGDNGLIGMRFRALTAEEGANCTWRFDDGTDHKGAEFQHVFAREGLRRVELTLRRQGTVVAVIQQSVAVHPQWTQLAECPDHIYGLLRDRALQLPLPQLTPADLSAFVRMAERMEDWPFFGALAEAVYARRSAFTGEQAATLHRLGFYYQRPGVMQYDRVLVVWRAVIDDATASAELRARTAVHLAGFFVHSGTEVEAGKQLLEERAPDEQLAQVERRLKAIFRADALVLLGQREAAVAAYRQAGNAVANNDTDYEVRRRGRIENARDYLRRREWDATEQVVRGLEWERPLERMELETGMLMVEVHRGRGEYLMALGVCRRLLAAAPADPRRSDLLLVAAQVCRDLKRDSECRKLLAQLLKEHPYSEAAALAKDRFGELGVGH